MTQTKSNNQQTRLAGLPPGCPLLPSVQSQLPLPKPTVQVGEEKEGRCALSLTLHQSYAASTAG